MSALGLSALVAVKEKMYDLRYVYIKIMVKIRVGWHLGILVILRCWNETMPVSSRFQGSNINSKTIKILLQFLPCLGTLLLNKLSDSYNWRQELWHLHPKSLQRSKRFNRTINPSNVTGI